MSDQDHTEHQQVETVKYSSPFASLEVAISIILLCASIPILCTISGKIDLAGIFSGLSFIGLLIIVSIHGIFLNPLAIETTNEGIVLKYFPNWYRTIPWTEIQFLKRRGKQGRYLSIKQSLLFDPWPVHFYIPSMIGPRQLELIDRLIAVICQQARLSSRDKTIWGYDIYMRDEQ